MTESFVFNSDIGVYLLPHALDDHAVERDGVGRHGRREQRPWEGWKVEGSGTAECTSSGFDEVLTLAWLSGFRIQDSGCECRI
jgi:hypothetical protein